MVQSSEEALEVIEFPMVLTPESLGAISQTTLLKSLNVLVISTCLSNHAYVDLKPIVLGGSDQQLSYVLIGTKQNKLNAPKGTGFTPANEDKKSFQFGDEN